MRVLVLISLVASLTDVISGSLLRGVMTEQDSEQDAGKIGVEKEYVTDLESRKLTWKFVPKGKVMDDDQWYADYSGVDYRARADPEDFLRRSDVCYKNGSYRRSNCPSEVDCNRSGKWGPAKLCINRGPRGSGGGYHVLAMKCIPPWENCDKCLCGIISSETESAECIRANRQGPDDDRVSIDCYGDASRVSIMGYTFDSSSSGSNGDDGGAGGGWVDGKGYTGHDDVLFTTYTVSKKGTDDYYIF